MECCLSLITECSLLYRHLTGVATDDSKMEYVRATDGADGGAEETRKTQEKSTMTTSGGNAEITIELQYRIDDLVPWYIAIILGFQVDFSR